MLSSQLMGLAQVIGGYGETVCREPSLQLWVGFEHHCGLQEEPQKTSRGCRQISGLRALSMCNLPVGIPGSWHGSRGQWFHWSRQSGKSPLSLGGWPGIYTVLLLGRGLEVPWKWAGRLVNQVSWVRKVWQWLHSRLKSRVWIKRCLWNCTVDFTSGVLHVSPCLCLAQVILLESWLVTYLAGPSGPGILVKGFWGPWGPFRVSATSPQGLKHSSAGQPGYAGFTTVYHKTVPVVCLVILVTMYAVCHSCHIPSCRNFFLLLFIYFCY